MDKEFLDRLMSHVDEDSLALTAQGGFLLKLVEAPLELGMSTELTDHLGYEPGDPAAAEFPNSRNGATPMAIETNVRPVGVDTPATARARSSRGWYPRAADPWVGWTR